MKRLLSFFALGVVTVIAIAATVKISDLPLSTNPSTNTFIEIADMNAATKSLKYPLDSVPSYARITNAMSWSGDTNNVIGGDGRERTVSGTGQPTNVLTVFNAKDYGWLPDGTDHTTAATNLLQIVYNSGGGTIFFPVGTNTYRADGQLFIPNDGISPQPHQVPIRFLGPTIAANWYAVDATNAPATLDLRYSGTNGGKFETRGRGVFGLQSLVIRDNGSSTNTSPFVHTSNTVLGIDDCTFIGCGSSNQDAIVLGGTLAIATNTVDAGFQGYGTRITRSHFLTVSRGVYMLTWANAITVSDCTWFGGTGPIALEIDARAALSQGGKGNVISGNTLEMDSGYAYAFYLRGGKGNAFVNNSFWDDGAQVISYMFLTNTATGNIMTVAHGDKTLLSGESVAMAETMVMQGDGNTESFGNGYVSAAFPHGAVVRGTYNSTSNYVGPLTVTDMFSPARFVGLGWDNDAGGGLLQAGIAGTSFNDLYVNPRGGNVGIGTTNPAAILDVRGFVTAKSGVRQWQGALTEAAGTVTMDYDAAVTDNSCTITGAVAIATANRGTNKWAFLTITGCSTNSPITWPSGARSPTGFPSISTAGKIMSIVSRAGGTTDADTQWWISEEP